jgi:hypothetical protein
LAYTKEAILTTEAVYRFSVASFLLVCCRLHVCETNRLARRDWVLLT